MTLLVEISTPKYVAKIVELPENSYYVCIKSHDRVLDSAICFDYNHARSLLDKFVLQMADA